MTMDEQLARCRLYLKAFDTFLSTVEGHKNSLFSGELKLIVKVLEKALIRAANELTHEVHGIHRGVIKGSGISSDGTRLNTARWNGFKKPDSTIESDRVPISTRKILL